MLGIVENLYRMVIDSLVIKSLKEKCVKAEANLVIGNKNNLHETWGKLYVCYECPDKYIAEMLQPIVNLPICS